MNFLGKLMPSPLSSAAVLALWLTLARSTSVGHVLVGFTLALAVPILAPSFLPTNRRSQSPLVILRFVLRVARDVVASNVEVAWSLVAWRWRQPQPKFVIVPLELRDPLGLAALLMVTTIVPGTVWSELALDRSALLLHVWDVGDEGPFIARFKARYEQPLKEIFG